MPSLSNFPRIGLLNVGTHIANAAIRSDIEDVCRARGYEPPVICTPEELLET